MDRIATRVSPVVIVDQGERHDEADFEAFVNAVGERVRRALVAGYGIEVGTDAAAEAMRVAWERWPEVATMANPAGFLFRVGQSQARPHVRWQRRRALVDAEDVGGDGVDSAALLDLFDALAQLRPAQRIAVVLVKSHGFTFREAADVMGISEAAVGNHVRRGLIRLRLTLEVHE